MICPTTIGWKAHAALARSGGVARVFAALTESVYLTADAELIWLGGPRSTLHARAVLAEGGVPRLGQGEAVHLDVPRAAPWVPGPIPETSRAALAAGCDALVAALDRVGVPDGFGTLLAGRPPPFPLDRAVGRAQALLRACDADDPGAAAVAALALLGLGPGLTPSGDDLVGGAFFARHLIARRVPAAGAWRVAAARILAEAPRRTHPISVALLRDLLDGHGHAPLHDLARALATAAAPVEAARQLVRIGHSSGWDLLAGFVAGCGGATGLGR